MRFARLLALFIAIGLLAANAAATVRETVIYSIIPSNGLQNSAANSIRTFNAAGGYPLGRIKFAVNLTAVNPNSFGADARIQLTSPNGTTLLLQPFPRSGTAFGFLSTDFVLSFATQTDAAGHWTFRFFESVDNGGTAQVDATWDLTVEFTDEPPLPPAHMDLGIVVAPGVSIPQMPVGSTGYQMYKLTLNRAVDGALSRYLDIAAGTGEAFSSDTELALFDANGNLLVTDDDTGTGFAAQLSFGAGTRPPYGDGQPLDGRNGSLTAGTYYLAVGTYDIQYTGQPWGMTFSGQPGQISLAVTTNLTPGVDCTIPVITSDPLDLVLSPGGSGAMSVSIAAGEGAAAYQWRHNGVPLSDNPNISGSTTASVTFNGADPVYNGLYDVVVTKVCGSITSAAARLAVICTSDFNGDGDYGTDQDIEAYFACLGGVCCATCGISDFNGDGDFGTDQDIEAFFRVLAGGAC